MFISHTSNIWQRRVQCSAEWEIHGVGILGIWEKSKWGLYMKNGEWDRWSLGTLVISVSDVKLKYIEEWWACAITQKQCLNFNSSCVWTYLYSTTKCPVTIQIRYAKDWVHLENHHLETNSFCTLAWGGGRFTGAENLQFRVVKLTIIMYVLEEEEKECFCYMNRHLGFDW